MPYQHCASALSRQGHHPARQNRMHLFKFMLYHYPPKGHHTVFTLIRVVQARRSGKLEVLDARQRERKRRSVRCLGEDRYTHIRYGDGILHFYVLFTCLPRLIVHHDQPWIISPQSRAFTMHVCSTIDSNPHPLVTPCPTCEPFNASLT